MKNPNILLSNQLTRLQTFPAGTTRLLIGVASNTAAVGELAAPELSRQRFFYHLERFESALRLACPDTASNYFLRTSRPATNHFVELLSRPMPQSAHGSYG